MYNIINIINYNISIIFPYPIHTLADKIPILKIAKYFVTCSPSVIHFTLDLIFTPSIFFCLISLSSLRLLSTSSWFIGISFSNLSIC